MQQQQQSHEMKREKMEPGMPKTISEEHPDEEANWGFPKMVVPLKSSILIGFSIINYPFWGTPIFGNTHLGRVQYLIRRWNFKWMDQRMDETMDGEVAPKPLPIVILSRTLRARLAVVFLFPWGSTDLIE